MKIKKLPINPHKADFIPFTGGLDVTSPQITIPPGYCRKSQNYEEDILGGYVTVTGYERFDGTGNTPSLAEFFYLKYTGSAQGITPNSIITSATSGKTAYVLDITPKYLIITNNQFPSVGGYIDTGYVIDGYMLINELIVGTSCEIIGTGTVGGVVDNITSVYQYEASEYYRNFIGKVGDGSCTGPVLGVWYYKGITYAFRNLVAGGVGLFASSSTGWQLVNLGIEVHYTSGNGTIPAIGTTIVKGTASGILRAITVESGSFAGNSAEGRLIFWSVTGTFTAGNFTSGISATCVLQHAITIPNQNGRFEFVTDNFSGLAITNKVYGVDGKNSGFEFDGSTFVQIHTGNTSDTPQHVSVHQGYLVYAFFGSLQLSAVGNPYNWQAINGAVEIGTGDNITGFVRQPGNETSPSLGVYCRNHTYMLYGNSSNTFQLINYNDTAGAIAYSAQKIGGHTFVYDDRGITNLQTTLNYGNFVEATISQRVKSLLAGKRNSFVDSHIMRDKQQYRLFFNDGSAIYVTLGAQINSFMTVQFPDAITCSVSAETYGGGPDIVFAGLDSGYVVQMERGTSFDGKLITAYMDLVFNNTKAYRLLKRYRRITLEMIGNGYAEYNTSYDLNYASTDYVQPNDTLHDVSMGVPNWDDGTIWDSNFTWDGTPVTNTTMAIDGDGMNIAIKIMSSSNAFATTKFSGALLEYSPQRMLR